MYYEIKAKRTIRLNPDPDATFSLSEQSQLGLLKQGTNVRRNILHGAIVKRLLPGVTVVGPQTQGIMYSVYVSEDQTRGELIRSLSPSAMARGSAYGQFALPASLTQELDREIIEPNVFIPLGEPRIDLFASIKARSWRRVIRTRFFVANITSSPGSEPAAIMPPTPLIPVVA